MLSWVTLGGTYDTFQVPAVELWMALQATLESAHSRRVTTRGSHVFERVGIARTLPTIGEQLFDVIYRTRCCCACRISSPGQRSRAGNCRLRHTARHTTAASSPSANAVATVRP